MSKSHEWIQKELENLRKKYPNKVILVCECKVIKVFEHPADIREIFNEAEKLCKGKDWSWAHIPVKEIEMILWL